jgi:phosphoribosyl-ATP pyrophosphohydrolase/phosphoribosyl-AMP cyclohydrolase
MSRASPAATGEALFLFADGPVDFQKLGGLIPAVVQDDRSGEVLMVGFMNPEALDRTVTTGYATFFSRTRGTLWMKGETSGNRLLVRHLLVDCDEDTVLIRVTCEGEGNVCHTGQRSCFFRELEPGANGRRPATEGG